MYRNQQSFRKLKVWQKAKKLVLRIYSETSSFPRSEMFGLTSQLRRAAVSVPANIAEGKERQYGKEFVQFLHIARGSLAEIEVLLEIAGELGYFDPNDFNGLMEDTSEVGRLLNGLINSLK